MYTKEEFIQQKVRGRELLLKSVVSTFKNKGALAVHQIGSGISEYKDEFSDLDILVMFRDEDAPNIFQEIDRIYDSIAPVLIKQENPQYASPGGRQAMVIHKTDYGLFHVDYYLSPRSSTPIKQEAKLLFGDDRLSRGEWIKDDKAAEDESVEKKIDRLICMSVIAVKGLVRGWPKGDEFFQFVKERYQELDEVLENTLPKLGQGFDFTTIDKILVSLIPYANKHQQNAIIEIRDYAKLVESLYPDWLNFKEP